MAISIAQIPMFRGKDPDDLEPKNFDASARLLALGNPTVSSSTVFVDAALGCPDGLLLISSVTYNSTLKRVSFVWSGGTPGQTYVVTCRLTLSNGWQIDQSGSVTIAQH